MPLLLVDGSSYLFRAYHALPHFTNKQGFPTGAIFGVLNMLRKLKEDFKDHAEILIVFDAKGKNFRHEIYPEYKANRSAMAEDLAVQIEPLHQLIQLLGFPLYKKTGVEADDVIGTLATQYAAQNKEVLIISGDKDLAQLLNPHVRIIDTMKNVEINTAYLLEKFGVTADKIIDLLTLTGDTSDNIPGVPGVGPKTAAKWLNEYGSLTAIIQHQDQIKGKVGENLKTHLPHLPLSKRLVTIQTDLHLENLPSFKMTEPQLDALLPLLQEYGLDSWLKALNTTTTETEPPQPQTHYHLIHNETELQQFIKQLRQQAYFAFDTETNGLDALQADLVGISFAFKNSEAYFIPLKHDTFIVNNALEALAPIFADPLIGKIAHHAKFDLKVLHCHGIAVQGILFDTLLAAYLLNSGGKNDLHSLALRELGLNGMQFETLVGEGRKQIPIESVPLDKLSHYACEDADFTWQLYEKMRHKLESHPRLNTVFNTLEMPLFEVLASMEEYGVLIDIKQLEALSQAWGTRLHQIGEEIFKETNLNFNLNSPKQLIEVLYGKLGLPATHKTPKGEPSTNEAALQDLAPLHPVPQLLLEHRHLAKLKNTYTDKLPNLVHSKTGRIHTQYQQAVVATGRLSSSDPNLQNIPFKTPEGKKIRQAFIAAPGCVLISADYSQVELRIMAHLSNDTGLIKAFQEGKDIHRATAAEVLGIPESAITPDQRRHAKAVNFGLIYGMSSFGLAKQLQISRKDADAYIKMYFERYPGVLQYMENTRLLAHEQGYIETLMGRRLDLPKINSRNMMEKKAAERAAINAPMQGTAADIIKKAMIDFWHWQNAHPELNTHLTMQVHDELVVEAPEIHATRVSTQLKATMENVITLKVPLLVDIECGRAWD
jgi:DNA polymerase-1